ncbi:MAG: Na/Pi cotransporter family protein [Ruminococcaceae bacterium]|nr:Na/Pi cotransporter family protein [Oscillospiraceae bacterium]
MDIFSIFTLLGGLATFLFGMNVMGEGLEKRSGDKLKSILEHLTSSPLKGLLLGAAVTAVIQSSSATTVMVVGFVNSGIMKLSQSIGVIMGANIGTTMTAWLISLTGIEGDSFLLQLLKPSSFAPVLAFIGIIMIMFAKRDNAKHTGSVLVGFGILMTGMELMSGAVKPLADNPDFANILLLFSNPILGILTGALLTAIIQSSSASVGILQALSVTGGITYSNAVPIILGQNIGTTVTAIISSIGTNKNARRTAVVHLCFNIIGALVFMLLFYGIHAIVGLSFFNNSINAAGIAAVHTIFNVTSTVVLFPFNKALEKLAYYIIKEDPGTGTQEKTSLLDERLLPTPSIAIARAKGVTDHMAEIARDSLLAAMSLVDNYSEEIALKIREDEKIVDNYEDKLGTYGTCFINVRLLMSEPMFVLLVLMTTFPSYKAPAISE